MKRLPTKLTIMTMLVVFALPVLSAQTTVHDDFVDKTFVFEISNKEAEKLMKSKPKDTLIRRMLHNQVAVFKDKWEDMPEKGHFIFANINQNRVDYQYMPVMPFKVFLYKEYGILTLQVVDGEGNVRKDAKVRIAGKWKLFNRAVPFDRESQTYRIDDQTGSRQRLLTVELDKFKAVFDLTKHLVNPWYGGYGGQPYSRDFYSYMITDKNKYRPGEKVRFKSYALTGSRRPLKKGLELWVQTGDRYKFKRISAIAPYNPGGYAGEFQLHDSLELKLDRSYALQLREPGGRIVAGCRFSYEDYVLYDNLLKVSLADNVHYFRETNKLEIQVTDANGLFIPDTEADVLVRRQSVARSYAEVVTIPDTLMSERISLDNSAPTQMVIPDGLFGEADGSYEAVVTVVTPDGQRMSGADGAIYFRSRQKIETETRGDTIRFEYHELGKPVPATAEIFYDGSETGKKIGLPYEERFGQRIRSYRLKVEGKDFEEDIHTSGLDPKLGIEGGITHDSLNIRLVNPLALEVSWYVYQGNIMIGKGAGKEMDFGFPQTDLGKTHYVEIFYFMGDTEHSLRRTFAPKTEQLSIELDLPERAYPGQSFDVAVKVSDHLGYPVKGADLTAFAYNSLLNYNVEDLPDYGPKPQTREQRASYSINRKGYTYSTPLDYAFWSGRASLGEHPYYRFVYPREGMSVLTEETPDGVTQFAPYVMKNGAAVNIYIIELDGDPVWFSWTQQTKAYSFPIYDDSRHTVTLRLHDRALVVDGVRFSPGRKTILSVDLGHLPASVRVLKLPYKDKDGRYTLSPTEKERYGKLLSRFPVSDRHKTEWLYQKNDTILIYEPLLSPEYYTNIIAGPIPPVRSRYGNHAEYRHEGGFNYDFEPNVVYKYPDNELCPDVLRFFSSGKIKTLGDLYLSPEVYNKKTGEARRRAGYWSPSNIYIYLSQQEARLNFRLPADMDSSGVANLIFYDSRNNTAIYPDKYEKERRRYTRIAPGSYDAVLLYHNGKYLRYDSVPVRNNAYTEVDMTRLPLLPADPLSKKWLEEYGASGAIGETDLSGIRTTTYYRQASTGAGYKVTGFVLDNEGLPLPGATVLWKGTPYGTVTNIDGYFELTSIDFRNRTLQVSYLGFETFEAAVVPGTMLHAVMKADHMNLDEVVVTGFGTQLEGRVYGVRALTSAIAVSDSPQPPPEDPDEEEGEGPDPEAEERLYGELLTLGGLRSNFSDVGFWEPSLVTDRKGEAYFSVTLPDNITKWNTVVYAMNRRLKTGTYRLPVRSYKPLMAELRMPRFLVTGDSVSFIGNIRNYTADSVIKGVTEFMIDADTAAVNRVEFSSSVTARLPVTAHEADSLSATYMFTRDDGYKDGEKRTVSIIPKGTEISEGSLGFMEQGKRMEFKADDGETLDITVTGKQLDIYLNESWHLSGYPYSCNEQLASKLIGLLNIRLYNQYEKKDFKYDRQVNTLIRKLTGNRNSNKLWSWFGDSPATSYWMSAHVLRALKMAKDSGYTVNLDLSLTENDYTDAASYRKQLPGDIEILNVLSEWGAGQDYHPAVKYWEEKIRRYEITEDSVARANRRKPERSFLKEKLLLWEIRQRHNIGYHSDSVARYLKKDVLGAVYCDDGVEREWYGDRLITTLIAYRIVRNDPALAHNKEPMQMYILGTKSAGWNTYRSASALGTVFPDLLAESYSKKVPATLTVTGKENRTVTGFPYRAVLRPGESMAIEKGKGMPLIYSAYTKRLVAEARHGEAFDIETRISGEGRFRAGQIDTLVVNLRVKQRNAEHVIVEIPIPAGCDYAAKPNPQRRPETHREYFKEKAVIFFEAIPEGEYTFRIELLPRYSGRYSVNPAKAEMMYFPVVSANNAIKEVKIE